MAKPGGARSRNKGRRGENEVVRILHANGYTDAERVSEAGLAGPDLTALRGRVIEVKRRGAGAFRFDYANLEDVNLVIKRADHETWLAVMELDELFDLLDEARQGRLPVAGEAEE